MSRRQEMHNVRLPCPSVSSLVASAVFGCGLRRSACRPGARLRVPKRPGPHENGWFLMYKWIGTVALGLAVGSLLACSTRLATQDSGQQTRPRATIAVARDGGVSRNGKPATIAALRAELE